VKPRGKHGGGHHQLDGLDNRYVDYLHDLFSALERRCGDALWWMSMAELADSQRAEGACSAGRRPALEQRRGDRGCITRSMPRSINGPKGTVL
jgi:hypothetical protein